MFDKTTKCSLCNSIEYSTVYEGKIRDGSIGNYTKKDHKVVKCKSCNLIRLYENPNSNTFYKTEEYREKYNDTSSPDDYLKMHDGEQSSRLEKIGIEYFRNKVVLDFGCGGGSFLDLIRGVAKETLGIEPFEGYHNHLSNNHHKVFRSADEALENCEGKIDTIVSTGVIEHVENPLKYLIDAYKLLKAKGKMYIETDNINDILFYMNDPELNKFFYRTVHLWYFEGSTLQKISEKAGFKNVKVSHRHNFDLSNLLIWLKDKAPSGVGKLKIFDDRVNNAWKSFLEDSGQSDLVCVTMSKD